ncbi:MAG: putative lipid II flippase FtsW [Pseudomonadota bacterium]
MSAVERPMMNIRLPFRRLPKLHLDVPLILMVALLLGLGLVMLTSASVSLGEARFDNPFFHLRRQLQALCVGLLAGAALLAIPTSAWQRTSYLLLLFALALLVLVVIPGVGHTVNGATRWISLAGINFQVSEPARVALILYVAGYAVRQEQSLRNEFVGLLRPMVVLSIAAALLLLEPDFGAATVLLATNLALLFIAGARLRDFLVFGAVGIVAFGVLAITSEYRLKRLLAFMNPWQDPYDSGFQLTQSLIAIGRGEWFGVGLGGSVQKLFYLPEAHTDFVFAVFAEEFGLLGSVLFIGLVLMLVLRILRIAREAAALSLWFQSYVATGIGIWLGLQSFINIGVNTGMLPTKGLTLPLVSYGRSSIIVVIASLCLVLRIHHEIVVAQQKVTARGRGRS